MQNSHADPDVGIAELNWVGKGGQHIEVLESQNDCDHMNGAHDFFLIGKIPTDTLYRR